MDEEHRECVRALNALYSQRDQETLQNCYTVLAEHFKDEEALLDSSIYAAVASAGASSTGFSSDKDSRKTHYADHARMLKIMRKELSSFSSSKSHVISQSFVKNLMKSFSSHAEVYDSHYAGKLGESD
jgi:hemerythrin